jgi:hypothetical protein
MHSGSVTYWCMAFYSRTKSDPRSPMGPISTMARAFWTTTRSMFTIVAMTRPCRFRARRGSSMHYRLPQEIWRGWSWSWLARVPMDVIAARQIGSVSALQAALVGHGATPRARRYRREGRSRMGDADGGVRRDRIHRRPAQAEDDVILCASRARCDVAGLYRPAFLTSARTVNEADTQARPPSTASAKGDEAVRHGMMRRVAAFLAPAARLLQPPLSVERKESRHGEQSHGLPRRPELQRR